jgi:hypothetical protein
MMFTVGPLDSPIKVLDSAWKAQVPDLSIVLLNTHQKGYFVVVVGATTV